MFANKTAGPYGGTPAVLPGKIELENYDYGGQGVAYNDANPENQGKTLPGEPVRSSDTLKYRIEATIRLWKERTLFFNLGVSSHNGTHEGLCI